MLKNLQKCYNLNTKIDFLGQWFTKIILNTAIKHIKKTPHFHTGF